MEAICGLVKEVSRDERRTIKEFNNFIPGFSVQMFKIGSSPQPLGKHGHGKNKSGKVETFTIIEGGGFLLFATINQDGELTGGILKIQLTPGSVVQIPPMVGHTFYLESGTEMHCFSNVPFDKDDFILCPELVEENFKTV